MTDYFVMLVLGIMVGMAITLIAIYYAATSANEKKELSKEDWKNGFKQR